MSDQTSAAPEPMRWTWKNETGRYITLTFPADALCVCIADPDSGCQWRRLRDGRIEAWYSPDQLELAMTAALAWLEARATRHIEGLRAAGRAVD